MSFLQKAKMIFEATDLSACPISMLCLSIDQLSSIQKEYGDQVIKSIAREFAGTLVSSTREDDLVGYYNKSNDENLFIVMLVDAGAGDIDKVLERISSVVKSDLLLAAGLEHPYSISIGHSSSNQNSSQEKIAFNDLVDQARAALIATKELEDVSVLGWSSRSNAA